MIDIPTNDLPAVMNPEYVARLLECEPGTVEEGCRSGDVPGLKIGTGWIIPTGALLTVINNVALQQANERQQKRKEGVKPSGTLVPIGAKRTPPQLPEM